MMTKFQLRCTEEDKARLKKYAVSRGRTASSIIRELLAEKEIITL